MQFGVEARPVLTFKPWTIMALIFLAVKVPSVIIVLKDLEYIPLA